MKGNFIRKKNAYKVPFELTSHIGRKKNCNNNAADLGCALSLVNGVHTHVAFQLNVLF